MAADLECIPDDDPGSLPEQVAPTNPETVLDAALHWFRTAYLAVSDGIKYDLAFHERVDYLAHAASAWGISPRAMLEAESTLSRADASERERWWALQHAIPTIREIEAAARARISNAQVNEQRPTAETDSTSKPPESELVAQSKRVKLFKQGKPPWVDGKPKQPLTKAQHNVVLALIRAGETGLSMTELMHNSGHDDARKIMGRLAKDDDWKAVWRPAGRKGTGYRIL